MIENIFSDQANLMNAPGTCDDCVCGCSEDDKNVDAGDDSKAEHKEEG
ncbi:hypothetical protein J7K93_01365 [bacterium]|nr:hypothetical protein [bacterium]